MPQGRGYPSSGSETAKPNHGRPKKPGQPDASGPMPAKTSKGRPPTKKVTSAISSSSVGGTYPVTSADE